VNFLQIAERVTEEVNGLPLAISSVDLGRDADGLYIVADPVARRAIRAAQQSFDWIMEFSQHWKFLNRRGEIFHLAAGVSEYVKPAIESLEWDSLYLTKSGSTTRWPIYQEQYDCWQARERVTVPTSSIPLYLIWGAQPTRWIVWPTPNEQWILNGNWQYSKTRLEYPEDEPPWEEKYHELVVWRAVMLIESRQHVVQDQQLAENASAAQRAFTSLWAAFMDKYLPKIRAANALA
jgi:hypothetical protein